VPSNTIELDFADGEYTFALPLARINELQRKCNAGIGEIFARLLKGCVEIKGQVSVAPTMAAFYVEDVVETIRQGLIGGGKGLVNGEEVKVTDGLAHKLIESYVLTKPLVDSWSIAVSILTACIVGYDPPKKD
jgi:tetrahydromethanopterin S-methyltransferase subunit F